MRLLLFTNSNSQFSFFIFHFSIVRCKTIARVKAILLNKMVKVVEDSIDFCLANDTLSQRKRYI